jgi:hypothetical protein
MGSIIPTLRHTVAPTLSQSVPLQCSRWCAMIDSRCSMPLGKSVALVDLHMIEAFLRRHGVPLNDVRKTYNSATFLPGVSGSTPRTTPRFRNSASEPSVSATTIPASGR